MSSKRKAAREPPSRSGGVPTTQPSRSGQRLAAVDALRGFALCLMFLYHFCFDLRFYRVIAADFEHHPFWLTFRAVIVSLFMLLVGVSLVLADRAGTTSALHWRRIGWIAACALTVSIASWFVFPRSFIYFGILHCIAVMSILASPLVRSPWSSLALGLAVILAGITLTHPVFDSGGLSWMGFVTTKPITEDYVSLAPWGGVVLVGIAIGNAIGNRMLLLPSWLEASPRWLTWLGRHSLAVYMVHQPILLGVLALVVGGFAK